MKTDKKELLLMLIVALCFLYSCSDKPKSSETDVSNPVSVTPVINYTVTNYFQHDTALFTEGFLIHNGQLLESTGSPEGIPQARSLIGITDLSTGKFDTKAELDKTKYFGEGIVFFKDKLYQLYVSKSNRVYL